MHKFFSRPARVTRHAPFILVARRRPIELVGQCRPLASAISCLRSHGLTVADGAQLKQVKAAFAALTIAQQQQDLTACGPLLPLAIRQEVAQRIADEKAAGSTASTSP